MNKEYLPKEKRREILEDLKERVKQASYGIQWNAEKISLMEDGPQILNEAFGADTENANDFIGRYEKVLDDIIEWSGPPLNASLETLNAIREQWETDRKDLVKLIEDIIEVSEDGYED